MKLSDEERRANRKAALHRYNVSEKGKAAKRRYRQTQKGKLADRRYSLSEKGRATKRRWRNSPKGSKYRREYLRAYYRTPRGRVLRFFQRRRQALADRHERYTGDVIDKAIDARVRNANLRVYEELREVERAGH